MMRKMGGRARVGGEWRSTTGVLQPVPTRGAQEERYVPAWAWAENLTREDWSEGNGMNEWMLFSALLFPLSFLFSIMIIVGYFSG